MARTYTTPGRKIPADKGWAELRNARKSINFTQQELADELGVSKRTIQSWELGTVSPTAFYKETIKEKVAEIVKRVGPRPAPTRPEDTRLCFYVAVIKDWDNTTPVCSGEVRGGTMRAIKQHALTWAKGQQYTPGIIVIYKNDDYPADVTADDNMVAWRVVDQTKWHDVD